MTERTGIARRERGHSDEQAGFAGLSSKEEKGLKSSFRRPHPEKGFRPSAACGSVAHAAILGG